MPGLQSFQRPPIVPIGSERPGEEQMGQPGIKGAVFEGIIAQVRELRDKGKISPAELERYLGREGVALLDTKIQVASWYSIQVYGRIRELLRDVVGGGRD